MNAPTMAITARKKTASTRIASRTMRLARRVRVPHFSQ
jgi:hypothetical protein